MASGTFPSTKDVVAIDCEMVGTGPEGKDSILARASIVNYFGKVLPTASSLYTYLLLLGATRCLSEAY